MEIQNDSVSQAHKNLLLQKTGKLLEDDYLLQPVARLGSNHGAVAKPTSCNALQSEKKLTDLRNHQFD